MRAACTGGRVQFADGVDATIGAPEIVERYRRGRTRREEGATRLDGNGLAALDLRGADIADLGIGRAGARTQKQRGRCKNPSHRSISGATMSRLAMSATRSATMQPLDFTWMIFIALNEPVRKRARYALV